MSVKSLFTSRYPNGVIIQGDQSQLEVRVLAYLSEDERLKLEIINDVDIHTNNCILWKKRKDITPEERTAAKAMTFQLTYGSGPYNMANILGIPVSEAKAFIKAFYNKYQGVRLWHEQIIEEVKNNCQDGKSYLQGPSGRRWVFNESIAPDFLQAKGIFKSFGPTDIKNYPCQGTAADILIIQRGQLFRKAVQYREKFLVTNTVHDSIMLDCRPEYVTIAVDLLKTLMEDREEINKVFSKEFDVPLKADISVGPSWAEMQNYEDWLVEYIYKKGEELGHELYLREEI